MAELLRRPFGAHGKVHDITPESQAGVMSVFRSTGFAPVKAPPKRPGRKK